MLALLLFRGGSAVPEVLIPVAIRLPRSTEGTAFMQTSDGLQVALMPSETFTLTGEGGVPALSTP